MSLFWHLSSQEFRMLWKVTFWNSPCLWEMKGSCLHVHRWISWSRKVRERTRKRIQISFTLIPRHSHASLCVIQALKVKGVTHPKREGRKDAQPPPPSCLLPSGSQEVNITHLWERCQVPSCGDTEQTWGPPFQYWQSRKRVFCLIFNLLDGLSYFQPTHMQVLKRFPSLSLWFQRSRNCEFPEQRGALP